MSVSILNWNSLFRMLKFIYSEKATKFFEISTVDLSYVVTVKSAMDISQNFVAFSEYMNFNILQMHNSQWTLGFFIPFTFSNKSCVKVRKCKKIHT